MSKDISIKDIDFANISYDDVRDILEQFVYGGNVKNFTMALISVEKGILDKDVLEKVYDTYIEHDWVSLLSEDISSIVRRVDESSYDYNDEYEY